LSACSPFGKGGLRGILRIYAYLLSIKSPLPLFSKEGDNGLAILRWIYPPVAKIVLHLEGRYQEKKQSVCTPPSMDLRSSSLRVLNPAKICDSL